MGTAEVNEAKAGGETGRRPWVAPTIESDTIYETRALGCAQCLNGRPGTEVGWGDGNCLAGIENY